jgi:thiol-disulfide isomerase/thioredoxin
MKFFIKAILGFLFNVSMQNRLVAQEPLLVGDRFPELELPLLSGNAASSIRVPDSSKKLILLDYWATNCASCIASFPQMEKLQEQFKNDIQVILVNPEPVDSTDRFFKNKRRNITRPSLPMVSGSAILNKLVPSDYVPWHVWIDSKGIVKFITEGFNANPENIEIFIRTGNGNMGQLYASAIFDKDNIEQKALDAALFNRVQFYSYLGRLQSGHHWDVPRIPHDFAVFSSKGSIARLFEDAFFGEKGLQLIPQGKVILEVQHPERFIPPKDKVASYNWISENCYNYFLTLPAKRSKELFTIARQELNQFFEVSASLQQRAVECYALVESGKGRDFRWNNNSVKSGKVKGSYNFSNSSISAMVDLIGSRFYYDHFPEPVINATGYTGNIDVRISRESLIPLNLDLLRKELQEYGLDIIRIFASTEVLVIKEKENK